MKKFLLNISLYLAPFVLLLIFSNINYTLDQGDIGRVEFFKKDDIYYKQFDSYSKEPIYYVNLSEVDTTREQKFSFFLIGDSFSAQKNKGYHNYFAKYDSLSLLFFDRRDLNDEPLDGLYGLINGGMFDKIKVDYIILQSVERFVVNRGNQIDKNVEISFDKLFFGKKETTVDITTLSVNSTLKYPYYNIKRLYTDKGNKCMQISVYDSLFTSELDYNLSVYKSDINEKANKNNLDKIKILNDELNNLSDLLGSKGIKLIVLIAPDKYDVYYNIIQNKEKFKEPQFFSYYSSLNKNYIYANVYDTLKYSVDFLKVKDVYYVHDSHWSPIGAKIVADKLYSITKDL